MLNRLAFWNPIEQEISFVRGERIVMALMNRTRVEFGEPRWDIDDRWPPLPFRAWPRDRCTFCGQPVFAVGAWWPDIGPQRGYRNTFSREHIVCSFVRNRMIQPKPARAELVARQCGFCAETGEWLHGGWGEIDHIIPLSEVRLHRRMLRWPDVLRFWGPANLQVLTSAAHRDKTTRDKSHFGQSRGWRDAAHARRHRASRPIGNGA